MIRRGLKVGAMGTGLVVAVLGVEAALAVNRRYLPTSPAMELGGTFGSPDSSPLRFVVLGDSTGAGVGADEPALAYPTLLAEALAAEGRRVELHVFAVSGARVADVAGAQLNGALALDPDLVFIAIGGNDATHLTGLGSVRRDMARALDAVTASGATVVVAGPADMRGHNFLPPLRQLVGWRGRRVEAVIEGVATARGIAVVPLRERTGHLFAADPDRYFSDDLFHPGPDGYAAWAEAILPELREAAPPAGGPPSPLELTRG